MTQLFISFFLALSLCHSVQAKKENRPRSGLASPDQVLIGSGVGDTMVPSNIEVSYSASSPDELALVEAAKSLGVAFTGLGEGQDGIIQVATCTKMRSFTLEENIEFTSARKRQSVILRDEKGNYLVLTKGADSHVVPLVTKGPIKEVEKNVTDFSLSGYRTLIICKRLLSAEQGSHLISKLRAAKSLVNEASRREAVSLVESEIESDLQLMGATAVEDKLQDFVPQTMRNLREAGVIIWVLTGDKEETAIAVSRMAGHLEHNSKIIKITGENTQDIGRSIADGIRQISPGAELGGAIRKNLGRGWAVVIPGSVISMAIRDHKKILETLLVKIRPESVIFCRMAPIQKAEVVRLVRNSKEAPMTLAVGDGANDVSMIQEAHVGVGLYGKEGRAAARNSDYALARFYHLERLLLFHGRMFYYRLATLVQYFFYKNLVYVLPQLMYQFRCGFSQLTLYDGFYLTLYNTAFTALPILAFGTLERDLPEDSICKKPFIYKDNLKNKLLNLRAFVSWTSEALFQGGLIFIVSSIFFNGKIIGNADFGVGCYTVIVLVVSARLAVETTCWTWLTHLILWGTVSSYLIFGLIYSSQVWTFSSQGANLFWVMQRQWGSSYAWLCIPLLMVMCILPIVAQKVFQNEMWPSETLIEQKQVNLKSSNVEYSASPVVQLNRLIRWWNRHKYGEDARPIPVHQSQSYSSIHGI